MAFKFYVNGKLQEILNSLSVSQLAVTSTNYTMMTLSEDTMYEVRLFEEGAPSNYTLSTAIYSTSGEASHVIQHGTYSIDVNFDGADLRFSHNAGSDKQIIGTIIRVL